MCFLQKLPLQPSSRQNGWIKGDVAPAGHHPLNPCQQADVINLAVTNMILFEMDKYGFKYLIIFGGFEFVTIRDARMRGRLGRAVAGNFSMRWIFHPNYQNWRYIFSLAMRWMWKILSTIIILPKHNWVEGGSLYRGPVKLLSSLLEGGKGEAGLAAKLKEVNNCHCLHDHPDDIQRHRQFSIKISGLRIV